MCHFSSDCLEVALLVKWNVDYLARTVEHARKYSQLCWSGK